MPIEALSCSPFAGIKLPSLLLMGRLLLLSRLSENKKLLMRNPLSL